jgi:hypothetical protein
MSYHAMIKIRSDRDLQKYFAQVVNGIHANFRVKKKRVEETFQYEMETLLRAINWERALRFKEPISMVKLLKIEAGAAGHSDYAHKLALYSSELVLLDWP